MTRQSLHCHEPCYPNTYENKTKGFTYHSDPASQRVPMRAVFYSFLVCFELSIRI